MLARHVHAARPQMFHVLCAHKIFFICNLYARISEDAYIPYVYIGICGQCKQYSMCTVQLYESFKGVDSFLQILYSVICNCTEKRYRFESLSLSNYKYFNIFERVCCVCSCCVFYCYVYWLVLLLLLLQYAAKLSV